MNLKTLWEEAQKWVTLLLLNKRMMSLYWRCGGMIAGGFLATAGELVTGASIPPEAKVFLGLLIGEITKYVNNKSQGK